MRLKNCHNFHDFRQLAQRRLLGQIFNYIDGAADDEVTLQLNTAAFDEVDLQRHCGRNLDRHTT